MLMGLVGLEGGSRWFKQGLEVGCKEERILEFWEVGVEPLWRAWIKAKVARGGSSGWLRLKRGFRAWDPWGWLGQVRSGVGSGRPRSGEVGGVWIGFWEG